MCCTELTRLEHLGGSGGAVGAHTPTKFYVVGGGGGGGGQCLHKMYSGRHTIQVFVITRSMKIQHDLVSFCPHRLASELETSECLCYIQRITILAR